MELLLQCTIRYMIPLMIVALAGVFAERSGIINIALEGIMLMGAFTSALFLRKIQEYIMQDLNYGFTTPTGLKQLTVILGLLLSAVVGAAFAMLLGYAAIRWKADQTITGTALNMIAPAIVLFVAIALYTQEKITLAQDAPSWCIIRVSEDLQNAEGFFPALLRIFFNKAYITTYICIVLYVFLSVILFKTKFGLRLRACGEHPQAASSVGIDVIKMRYVAVLISGALGGIGGYTYSLTIDNGSTNGSVAGLGFLAMAIMIFGNWNPGRIAIVSFFFGILRCMSSMYGTLDINGDGVYALKELADKVPFFNSNLYNMLPYIATLVVLAFTSKKTRAPKAEGIPYDKGQR